MYKEILVNVPLWQFENLGNLPKVKHFVSGREGGVSVGEIGTLNLSFSVNDEPERVHENRRRIAAALGIAPTQLFFPRQTHISNIKVVDTDTRPEDLTDTDALITNAPGICISVMSADCVPVLLYDPVNHAAAAIHAGWRGTVDKIVTKTIERLQKEFGTDPADLIAGIGPSICPEVYEVGAEVIEAANKAFENGEELLKPSDKTGKAYFNLWEANRVQMLALGVKPKSIEVAGICTLTESDKFFSARRSSNSGRFAAGILLL